MRTWMVRTALVLGALTLCVVMGGWAFVSSLDLEELPQANRAATATDIAWLRQPRPAQRGRVLAVVTSTSRFTDGKRAGYELTELSRAYWVFLANGYAVDIASPGGGEPEMVLDGDDVTDADYAFLNDREARALRTHTQALSAVDASRYAAVYFVGGKGTMFDFPGNPDIARIVADIDTRGGVVGAVCHGPVALVGLENPDGTPWLRGRRVTGFTNAEELFLLEDARTRFPWLLQDRLSERGALFDEGPLYLRNVVVDQRLVTGQNPWSTWAVAEAMVRALGHEPVPRPVTAEESSVELLLARAERRTASPVAQATADRRLVLMHAVVAAMQWQLLDAWQLQRLARTLRDSDDGDHGATR